MSQVNVLERPQTLAELFDGAVQGVGGLSATEQDTRRKVEQYLGTLGVSEEAQIDFATLAGQIKGELHKAVAFGLVKNREIITTMTPNKATEIVLRLLSFSVLPSDTTQDRV